MFGSLCNPHSRNGKDVCIQRILRTFSLNTFYCRNSTTFKGMHVVMQEI